MPKKKKKHSGNNDLALSYRIDGLPTARVSKVEFFNRTLAYIDDGEPLPRGWKITLRWQNSKQQEWREDEFQTAISESRPGFIKLVKGRLVRDRLAVVGLLPEKKKPVRKKRKRKPAKKRKGKNRRKK